MARSPLRIGLLVDSFVQPAWIYQIVEEIQASEVAEVTLVVKNEAERRRKSFPRRVIDRRDYLLYTLYKQLDAKVFRAARDAFAPTDIRPLIADTPVVAVTPIQKKFSDYVPDAQSEEILAYNLDVALRFGFRILKGRALRIARYGVWSYHHGDNLQNRGGPPGFWEVMEGQPVSGSILQVLTEDLDNGRVLYRSYASTGAWSIQRNMNNYYWKSAAFVMRTLTDLYEEGSAALERDPLGSTYQPYSNRLYTAPDNARMLRSLVRLGSRYLRSKVEHVFYFNQWMLAYRIEKNASDMASEFYRFKPMIPPKDRFWADPFPVKRDDGNGFYIFIEELPYDTSKGHISVIAMDRSGTYQQPVTVLERPYHLSYPFIFEWDGAYYMIPETLKNKTIELYRCVSFPCEWRLEKVLMEGVNATDATLIYLDDRWWMFVSMSVDGASTDDELCIFHAPCPLGPWTPHGRNPVKSDVRSARPAGRLFEWQGRLYRPAQDCSKAYGYAISINRVERLNDNEYVETEVSKILPQWRPNLIATHTLNNAGGLTVIDGQLRRRR